MGAVSCLKAFRAKKTEQQYKAYFNYDYENAVNKVYSKKMKQKQRETDRKMILAYLKLCTERIESN